MKSKNIPSNNKVENQAKVSYNYTVDHESSELVSAQKYSDIVIVNITYPKLKITKLSDKSIAYVGDYIKYSIFIENDEDRDAYNVVIKDNILGGLLYKEGSLKVSVPSSGNLEDGIVIKDPIRPKEKVVISFSVKVIQIRNINPITNQANANHTYNPNSTVQTSISNEIAILLRCYNFRKRIEDIMEYIAMQEVALSNIIEDEYKKVKSMMDSNKFSIEDIACLNKSLINMLDTINSLESELNKKIEILNCKINKNLPDI